MQQANTLLRIGSREQASGVSWRAKSSCLPALFCCVCRKLGMQLEPAHLAQSAGAAWRAMVVKVLTVLRSSNTSWLVSCRNQILAAEGAGAGLGRLGLA